ncbi:MAG: hypothetical protein R6X13_12325, partial [bacterium]
MSRRAAGLTPSDCLGLVRPALDAHSLGLTSLAQLLGDCGFRTALADAPVCRAFDRPESADDWAVAERWLAANRVTALGFSYRLDPGRGEELFDRVLRQLRSRRLLADRGGSIRLLYFAGLPETCERVRQRHHEVAAVFRGDETPARTLALLGISPDLLPAAAARGLAYDEDRLAFGREIVRRADYLRVAPAERRPYPEFGTAADTLEARLAAAPHGVPLVRAHVGPWLPDRDAAVRLFLEWARSLAATGLLDILSIGTSQLSQSAFGEDWAGRPDGGGVPLAAREEFAAAWQAARPMLVRCYAGSKDIAALARMYEQTIHTAWHALSLWWFCLIDGRGPYPLRENLVQQFAALRYAAETGKPYEPNVAHHFAFRGADDVTCVAAAVLAARAARRAGISRLVLQVMLNTPKYTWGIQDLAKARAMLQLARAPADESFRVILQPRGGLDYFSPEPDLARAQLTAVTALMDDIEPDDPSSPPIIHVVSFSEATHLADPATVNESIQLTRHALAEYRRLRAAGWVDDLAANPEVRSRTAALVDEARTLLSGIESSIDRPDTAEGLYEVFARGWLPVPWLWECRDEFPAAVRWQTRPLHGGVAPVDESGAPISAAERVRRLAARPPDSSTSATPPCRGRVCHRTAAGNSSRHSQSQ